MRPWLVSFSGVNSDRQKDAGNDRKRPVRSRTSGGVFYRAEGCVRLAPTGLRLEARYHVWKRPNAAVLHHGRYQVFLGRLVEDKAEYQSRVCVSGHLNKWMAQYVHLVTVFLLQCRLGQDCCTDYRF